MSSQTARKYLKRLEGAGLVSIVEDGRFKRYYPSDGAASLEKALNRRLKSFWKILLHRLEAVNQRPAPLDTLDGVPAVELTLDGEQFVLRYPDNPLSCFEAG